jgi:periplasmic divalent cation tolerance protein
MTRCQGKNRFRDMTPFYIAWTAVASQLDADRLAGEAVGRGLAACVQVCPIVSHYRWKGRTERTQELQLAFKCAGEQLPALERFVLEHHPYDTPEWIVVSAERVSEKYLSWARSADNPRPL